MQEIWKSVVGYEGFYEVSNFGRVKSLERCVKHSNHKMKFKEKILSINKHNKGYSVVGLTKNGKTKYKFVHRLVAQAFILNPSNKKQVNHIDGNKTNNLICNLEWCSDLENKRHSKKLNLNAKGSNQGLSKLKESDVLEIRNMYSSGSISQREISEKFNVSRECISAIVRNKNWKHI